LRETLLNILGNASDRIKKTGDYKVQFNLPKFFPYVETVLFGLDILKKEEMENVAKTEWKTDETNTKHPPIGCGAYMWDAANTNLPNTVVLKPNPEYNAELIGHDPDMVGGGNWLPAPSITSVTYEVVKTATTAVTGLKDGEYIVIDSHVGIQDQAEEIIASDWGKILPGYEWHYQEMGINHMHPIFGMNPRDPREIYPGFRFPPDYETRNILYFFFSLLPFVILIPTMGIRILQKTTIMRK